MLSGLDTVFLLIILLLMHNNYNHELFVQIWDFFFVMANFYVYFVHKWMTFIKIQVNLSIKRFFAKILISTDAYLLPSESFLTSFQFIDSGRSYQHSNFSAVSHYTDRWVTGTILRNWSSFHACSLIADNPAVCFAVNGVWWVACYIDTHTHRFFHCNAKLKPLLYRLTNYLKFEFVHKYHSFQTSFYFYYWRMHRISINFYLTFAK